MTRQSPNELVLLHRPLVLCVALSFAALCLLIVGVWNISGGAWGKAGVAFLASAGLAGPAVWFGAEKIDVIFDAKRSACTVKTRRLSGASQESYKLSQIEEAQVQTHKAPGYGGGAHRIALVLAPGRAEDIRPLMTGYAGERSVSDLAGRINNWLEAYRTPEDT